VQRTVTTYHLGWRYARTHVCGSRAERKKQEPPYLVHGAGIAPHSAHECDGTCGDPHCLEWHEGFADALNT